MRIFLRENAVVLALLVSGPLVIVLGWGILGITSYLLFVFVLSLLIAGLKLQMPNRRLILESITISHYVEKVRWSLDILGIDYVEEESCGILGVVLLGRLIPAIRQGPTRVSGSNFILRYLYGKYAGTEEQSETENKLGEGKENNRESGIRKSEFLKPSLQALELEKEFDKMGDYIRNYLYTDVLVVNKTRKNPMQDYLSFWGYYQPSIPYWQRILLKVSMPVLLVFMKKALKLNPKHASERLILAKEVFTKVDALLKDGRKYLMKTDYPTFVDVTFAALAAPLLTLEKYTGGRARKESSLKREMMTPQAQKESDMFRDRPCGKFVLQMYEEHRQIREPPPSPESF